MIVVFLIFKFVGIEKLMIFLYKVDFDDKFF